MLGEASQLIKEGDLVIAYEGFGHLKPIRVQRGKEYGNSNGVYFMDDWAGTASYGDAVPPRKRRRELKGAPPPLYLLRPTAELWTQVLPHRTQIIYTPDIATIVLLLDLQPGGLVVEAGTGSGSLTHSLAKSVAPSGHVFTFDFHEDRSKAAQHEFNLNGLASVVTASHGDITQAAAIAERITAVCTEQSRVVPARGLVDAMFLDVPNPRDAVDTVVAVLRPTGRLCSFSPCIEQVQDTCDALRARGFRDVRMFEVLQREFETKPVEYLPLEGGEAPEREAEDGKEASVGQVQGKPARMMTRAVRESKGHTGFLTIAQYLP
eukprot:TRINITY_DN22124_c0_g1_i1.p1 TRINITY_DN22124_c0_g1~~TRINITY_DN22124_c0_g1_i1.p1  ORF type:complete len:332 (+),score=65.73 TRINITY_DN22124_c0_g1_i1:34-996(+)